MFHSVMDLGGRRRGRMILALMGSCFPRTNKSDEDLSLGTRARDLGHPWSCRYKLHDKQMQVFLLRSLPRYVFEASELLCTQGFDGVDPGGARCRNSRSDHRGAEDDDGGRNKCECTRLMDLSNVFADCAG